MTDDLNRIEERLVALTRDLILIPSIAPRPEDRQRCYEFVRNHLESIENIEVREFEYNGHPSLVSAPMGCHEPKILMCAHLDVVTHPDISLYHSKVREGRIYGPGAGDMKGALAILLEIFRVFHTAQTTFSLGIAITSDEEMGGESGIGYLFNQAGLRCGLAMIPDGGSLTQVTIEEKGILHLNLTRHGQAAHAARPWLGDNPIQALMEKLTKLQDFFKNYQKKDTHWYPTCSVTVIGTENQTTNRIPSNATAVLDLRFPPPFTLDEMIAKVKDILGPDIETKLALHANPTYHSPDPLYMEITKEITGSEVTTVRDDGGSDARFICSKGIPVVMSRPLVGNLHAEDEWIDIKSMMQFYQIYERYILRKFQSESNA